jgi:hypothetical protein
MGLLRAGLLTPPNDGGELSPRFGRSSGGSAPASNVLDESKVGRGGSRLSGGRADWRLGLVTSGRKILSSCKVGDATPGAIGPFACTTRTGLIVTPVATCSLATSMLRLRIPAPTRL